jgi:predicted 3-demethylubiquinone-9 3-methyltransferase (glyoxalase superfamily)
MNTYKRFVLAAIAGAILMGCGNARQDSSTHSDTDTISSQTSIKKNPMIKQKITPSLWVDKDAKAVVDYYLSIFKDGKMKDYRQYKNPPEAKEQGGPDSFETATMEIGELEFSILAAGPYFKFNESVSFVINCKDQAEVDYYWDALTKNGGEEGSCGWCKDKYGLSWQVVPVEYFDLINSDDPAVRDKAMRNTLKQKKLVLSALK